MTEIHKLTPEQERLLLSTKLLSLAGFAMRAGKLACGTDRICDEIRRHGCPDEGDGRPWSSPGFVLLCVDASDNTKKRITNACRYYRIELYQSHLTQDELASRLGKASAAACATFDRAFCDGFRKAVGNSYPRKRNRI